MYDEARRGRREQGMRKISAFSDNSDFTVFS